MLLGLTTFVTTRSRTPQNDCNTSNPTEGPGPGCGTRGRRQGLAKQQANAPSNISDLAPLVWRAPESPEGLAAVLVGGGGAWLGFEPTHKHTSAHQSPLVWRAPEGLEGLAATPAGGGGAWPGFEATRKATHQ